MAGQLNSGPRILSLDIETSPVVAHAWGLFKQNIAINQIIENPRTICFAAKFLDQRKVHFHSEFEDGHEVMVRSAHALLSETDVVMHWNGDNFDLPRLNTEFMLLGLTPPEPYKSIDLLKVVRANFAFTSNKLAHVSERLGLAGKVKHEGHSLWIKCLAGDPKAWALMRKYNTQDVRLLEEIYERVKPWISSHPHVGLYSDNEEACPNCGSEDRQRRGFAYTALGRFQQFRCNGCGNWHRSNRRDGGATTTQVK
jgi:DNA polymerase elongation subunit (family B)